MTRESPLGDPSRQSEMAAEARRRRRQYECDEFGRMTARRLDAARTAAAVGDCVAARVAMREARVLHGAGMVPACGPEEKVRREVEAVARRVREAFRSACPADSGALDAEWYGKRPGAGQSYAAHERRRT